ncbi:MAG: carbohydrate ABC transporter permease [Chloroflexaceae bacterium]|nr:carbohydrate ABC transporter permease [Chloroflexaceae bacterium]NJO04431.1 carbohydrate ABC transporter permease [Chloroflexaceae bacterium]
MPAAPSPQHKRGTVRHGLLSLLVTVAIALFSLTPLYWVVITSLKTPGTEFQKPLEYFPSSFSLESYRTVLGADFQMQDAIINSLIVSSCVTVGALFLAGLSAYAIARLKFTYKVQSLFLIQLAGMVPPIVVIAPTFVLVRSLGLLSSLPGLILPNIVYNIPLSTWLIAAYFASLPFELEDAAKVDGYAPFMVFLRVMLPLAAPGLFSAGVLAFLGSWGEFMLAFTVTLGLPQAQTVPVAILSFSRAFALQWAWVTAGIVLSLLPVILLVLIFQRWVVEGLTAGAVKY